MSLKAKLYLSFLDFGFLVHFLVQGLTWAALDVWIHNQSQVVGTCPGHGHRLKTENRSSKRNIYRPLFFILALDFYGILKFSLFNFFCQFWADTSNHTSYRHIIVLLRSCRKYKATLKMRWALVTKY